MRYGDNGLTVDFGRMAEAIDEGDVLVVGFEMTGKRLLIDCGLYQGGQEIVEENSRPFGFDPRHIGAPRRFCTSLSIKIGTLPVGDSASVVFLNWLSGAKLSNRISFSSNGISKARSSTPGRIDQLE